MLANPHSRHARDIAVERNGVRRVVSLCFVLLLTGGVLALEKWGTAAAVPELEALAAKSGNLGLQIQAKRIVPILKSRK